MSHFASRICILTVGLHHSKVHSCSRFATRRIGLRHNKLASWYMQFVLLAGTLLIKIITDERKRIYSATSQINLKSGKALCVRREERQVTLCKWKERLSRSSKGEWTHLLKHNLEVWLERGHGQMNFYLTQVMSSHGMFNAYLFHMKLVENPECTN